MIRSSDDPAQAEKFEAMRTTNSDRRAADTYANPVRGARNYGGAHAAVQRLQLMLLGATKVAPC